MDKIREWPKVGRPKILAENHGKRLIDQSFVNPTNGQTVNFTIFDSSRASVIIFPLTTRHEIVAVKQFRPAIGKIILELPGGNIDPKDKNIVGAAKRELLEETGYWAKELFLMPNKLWIDPSICTPYFYSLLALGCKKIKKPKNDENEDLRTVVLPLKLWMKSRSSFGSEATCRPRYRTRASDRCLTQGLGMRTG